MRALALLGLLAAACAPYPPGLPLDPPPVAPPVASLAGTNWTASDIAGAPPVAGGAPTAEFGIDGRVSGDASCNRYTGGYTQAGASLTFGELASTRRACLDAARSQQETRFLNALRAVTGARFEGERLVVSGPAGQIVFEPGPRPDGGFPRELHFLCEGGEALTVIFEADYARLGWSGGGDILQQRPAASGIWYESPLNTLRGKGNELTWSHAEMAPRTCRTQ